VNTVFHSQIYPKGWGSEEWIYNSPLYCGKFLVFQAGKRCSWHFHKIKDETFHLLEGKIVVHFSFGDSLEEANSVELNVGDAFNVPPGMRHQMVAILDSKLLEISTTHFEEDSYRIVKGD
jgi:mannose-6-phosphate isomerase-like protein (cupin superfamily)